MLTGTEKFIFSEPLNDPSSFLYPLSNDSHCTDLILFVLVTLLVVAASMYLPDHVAIIYRRIWYYVHGQGETAGVDIGTLGHVVRDKAVRRSGKAVVESIAAVRSAKGEL